MDLSGQQTKQRLRDGRAATLPTIVHLLNEAVFDRGTPGGDGRSAAEACRGWWSMLERPPP